MLSVLPKSGFVRFRTQDVGRRLIPDSEGARKVLVQLGSTPVRLRGDRFRAKPRPNGGPERLQPTPAQQRARRENIKKAQAA